MNYRKIEFIFLITFFLLNGYLFLTLYNEEKTSKNIGNTNDSIEEILKKEGVTLKTTLDTKQRYGYYLEGRRAVLEKEAKTLKEQTISATKYKIKSQLQSPIMVKGEESLSLDLKDFMSQKENFIQGDQYHYFPYILNKKNICYAQSYEGIPIDDTSAQVVFHVEENEKEKKVEKYEQQQLIKIKPLRDKMELIRGEDAAYTLFLNNKLTRGDTIEWLSLAYAKVYKEKDSFVYLPIWMVNVKNNSNIEEIYRINALTNHLMGNNNKDIERGEE